MVVYNAFLDHHNQVNESILLLLLLIVLLVPFCLNPASTD